MSLYTKDYRQAIGLGEAQLASPAFLAPLLSSSLVRWGIGIGLFTLATKPLQEFVTENVQSVTEAVRPGTTALTEGHTDEYLKIQRQRVEEGNSASMLLGGLFGGAIVLSTAVLYSNWKDPIAKFLKEMEDPPDNARYRERARKAEEEVYSLKKDMARMKEEMIGGNS